MVLSKNPDSMTASRRQKQIEQCLYANLLQRPYTSVSVSDLCHQMEISRKSFYNYFPDKDSCFRSIISRKLRRCALEITAEKPADCRLEDIITIFLNYWKQERSFLDIIVRNDLVTMLFDQCIRFLRDEDKMVLKYLNTDQLKVDDYVLAAYVNVHITIVIHWYKSGFDISVEEMTRKYRRLLYEPLLRGRSGESA